MECPLNDSDAFLNPFDPLESCEDYGIELLPEQEHLYFLIIILNNCFYKNFECFVHMLSCL